MSNKESEPVNWYLMRPRSRKIQSSETGLASEEARRRYEEYGPTTG